MIEISSNLITVIGDVQEKLSLLVNEPAEIALRTAVLATLPTLRKRVHVEGLDSNDQPIGTYSPGYMKVRTGNYSDAATYKQGANAGNFKDKKKAGEAGTNKKGVARPVYNRTSDTKVIGSLTRQLENDYTVTAIDQNSYGIGFNNSFNYDKAKWLEATYKKPILSQLTVAEMQQAVDIIKSELQNYFTT